MHHFERYPLGDNQTSTGYLKKEVISRQHVHEE